MNSNFTARGKRGEIWLYDAIGSSYWGDAMSAKMFQKELSALGAVDTIAVHINSPGGDVFEGVTIHNLLAQHPATVSVEIDGLAASIASVIAMSGKNIAIASNAMVMIHNPQGIAVGDDQEMERRAALLRQVKASLIQTYAARTGNLDAQLDTWMAEETWFTAEAAVENGFADRVTAATQVHACFDMSHCRNVPKQLQARARDRMPSPAMDCRRGRLADMRSRAQAHLQAA